MTSCPCGNTDDAGWTHSPDGCKNTPPERETNADMLWPVRAWIEGEVREAMRQHVFAHHPSPPDAPEPCAWCGRAEGHDHLAYHPSKGREDWAEPNARTHLMFAARPLREAARDLLLAARNPGILGGDARVSRELVARLGAALDAFEKGTA